MKKSNFPSLVLELKDIAKDMNVKTISPDRPAYQDKDKKLWNTVRIDLEWDSHIVSSGSGWMAEEVKTVSVIFSPDGTIQVRGKQTQMLPFNKWNNNPKFQEEALGKAYKNPGRMESTSYSPYQGAGS